MANYQTLKKAIEALIDPGYDKTLKEVEGLKKLTIGPTGVVDVIVVLKHIDQGYEQEFKLKLTKLVKVQYKFPSIKTEFVRNDFLPKGEKRLVYIGVASGKGGVGKSTVTANLAYALTKLGKKVGIIDADVYGASIPFILDMKIKPLEAYDDDFMLPLAQDNIEVVSTEFFMPKEKPLMWRGPILGRMLNHYFNGIKWNDDTDIILIDLPPGTGDVAIDVKTMVPKSKVVVVTTPHVNASNVAVKAGLGAMEIGHEVVGVIENMSYYYHQPTNEKLYLFGSGGGQTVSEKLGVELLGSIPIGMPEDSSKYVYGENDIQGKFFVMIAQKLLQLL